MTRVRQPCSALSSRTARVSRMAGSPRLMTAMRSNTWTPLLSVVLRRRRGGGVRLHVQAAVDSPDLACDVGRRVGGEEVDDAGDLLRLPEPAERDLRPQSAEHLVRYGVQHLGSGVPRGHGVDGDAEPVGGA